MLRCFLLALATLTSAAALPRYDGYVNDFAHRLDPADRDALETRLRDYERASSNEVAIAIVDSLEGQSVEDYARDLFHAWGIGKRDRNNGVLLLWAPAERKVRIQVGYGLEGSLSDRAASDILRDVTASFRREDYTAGLNAGIDGIIARLEGTGPSPRSRFRPEVAAIPVVAAAGGASLVLILLFAVRKRQLAASVPKDLDRAAAAMREAETLRQSAARSIETLRREAPEDVWHASENLPAEAAPELTQLYSELSRIQTLPRESLGDLSRAHGALRRWNTRFTALWNRLDAAAKSLDNFRYCRDQSPAMLRDLGATLARRDIGGGWGKSAKLEQAAAETYQRAASAAAAGSVNWLLVYDLLTDAQDCLQCADNPGRYQRRDRYWGESTGYSPAYDLLILNSAATESSSYSSSSSSSDGGASFGGGDSGGGGASSSY